MSTTRHDDVVVIGAGVTGASIAWHLAQAGIGCSVVEATGPGAGMTSVQAGGMRTQWSSRLTCRLALESRSFYADLAQHLDVEVTGGLEACGCAFLAQSHESLATMRDRVKLQQDEGVQSRLLDAEELTGLVPGLRPGALLGGSFNPLDGYFREPMTPVRSFMAAAQRAGQELVPGRVVDLVRSGAAWRVQLADGTALTASDVVVATGCDTGDVLALVGVEVPLRRSPRFLFYTEAVQERCVPSLLVFEDDGLVVKQLADGRLFGADLSYGARRRPGAGAEERLESDLRRSLSLPERVRFTSIVEGEYDVTPDQQLLVGPVPRRPGLWMTAGLQGRGMMLAPAVGRMAGQAVAAGWTAASTVVPDELLPDRFAEGWASDFEAQVI